MKKIIVLFLITLVFFNCKNENKEATLEENRAKSYDAEDGYITLKGDFLYFDDAAVLQANNEIYGVVVNDAMHQLNEKSKGLKTEETDMVRVTIRVRKFEKPDAKDTWKNWVEIKDVLNVEAITGTKEDVIKLGN